MTDEEPCSQARITRRWQVRFEVPCPDVFALLSQQHCTAAGLHGTLWCKSLGDFFFPSLTNFKYQLTINTYGFALSIYYTANITSWVSENISLLWCHFTEKKYYKVYCARCSPALCFPWTRDAMLRKLKATGDIKLVKKERPPQSY